MHRQPQKSPSLTTAYTDTFSISAVLQPVFVSSTFYSANLWWLMLAVIGWSFSIRLWSPGSITFQWRRMLPRRNWRKLSSLQWPMMISSRKSLKTVINSFGAIWRWKKCIAIGDACWRDMQSCWSIRRRGIWSWLRLSGSKGRSGKGRGWQ